MSIKILIADDHPLFRSGVKTEIENIPDIEIIGETGDGKTALNLIVSLKPDIAILDFQMPELNALEVMEKLNKLESPTRIILLTMHKDRKLFFKILDAGVLGYVLKDDAISDICKAVNRVAEGKHFISRDMMDIYLEKTPENRIRKNPASDLMQLLTHKEKKVLSMVSQLMTNDEIANALFISKRTVENHKMNIAGKLQLDSSKHLLKFVLENKDILP